MFLTSEKKIYKRLYVGEMLNSSPLLADLENKTKTNKTKLKPTQIILVSFISGDLHLQEFVNECYN